MAKIHRQKLHEQEMAWQSWEPLLRTKLENWVHFLESVKSDLSAAGMSKAKGEEFLHMKINEMLEQMDAKKKTRKVG